jgi:hypothetical protein
MPMTRLLLCGCLLAFAAGQDQPGPKQGKDQEKVRPAHTTRELLTKLARPVSFEKGIDANTQLKDALEFVSEQFDVQIIVNPTAFREVGVNEIESQPVRMPRILNVRLSALLRLVLGQVNATYVVLPEYVEIIPMPAAGPGEAPAFPPVYAVFEKRPLEQALRELSELTDVTILLDTSRANELAQAPMSAAIKKIPVDAAVRLLADMAGLKMVQADKVLYVTTRENADGLQKELRREKPKTPPPPGM